MSIYKYLWNPPSVPDSCSLCILSPCSQQNANIGGGFQRTRWLFCLQGPLCFVGYVWRTTRKSTSDCFQHSDWFLHIFILKYIWKLSELQKQDREPLCTLHLASPMITPYMTTAHYQNQEIDMNSVWVTWHEYSRATDLRVIDFRLSSSSGHIWKDKWGVIQKDRLQERIKLIMSFQKGKARKFLMIGNVYVVVCES